jgi:hypothetical protein
MKERKMRNKTRRGNTIEFVRFAVSKAKVNVSDFGLLRCEVVWFGR